MELYHGSNVKVENPNLNYSYKRRDFGKGFYLTDDYEQAKAWSIKKVNKLENGNPIVSVFEFNDFSDLKIKKFPYANDEWFDYVVDNRNEKEDELYDIVIGPIANDGTYEVINLYMRGILQKDNAILELKTYKLKEQYAFKTQKALDRLIYKGEKNE